MVTGSVLDLVLGCSWQIPTMDAVECGLGCSPLTLEGWVVSTSSLTDRSPALLAPLSTGILQARIMEWVAMLSSRESSQHRD